MEDCFQDAARHRKSFVAGREAVPEFAAGVDIAGFQALVNRRTVRQDAAKHAVKGTDHRNAVHDCRCVTHMDPRANLQQWMKDAVGRGAEDPFSRKAADQPGIPVFGSAEP